MIEKFGKSFLDILDLKQAFFEDNDRLLARAIQHAELYLRQPRRTHCKVCAGTLPTTGLLRKHGIDYALCDVCGHLNGLHEDTDDFISQIYAADGGAEYAETYAAADRSEYHDRRDKIYTPKADFLLEVLEAVDGVQPTSLRIADMGAGAGYFVSALRTRGVADVHGYEVGQAQVELANQVMEDAPVSIVDLAELVELTRASRVDLLSFIGVLEHLQDLRGALRAIVENRDVEYVYTSLPMFAPTVFNEAAFPGVMPRHLAGGHTHLFTHDSLSHLENEFSLERLGAWWFGTDVLDYFRSVAVSLRAAGATDEAMSAWTAMFSPLVDGMQLAMDRVRAGSQVHLVYRRGG